MEFSSFAVCDDTFTTLRALDNAIGSYTADGDTSASFAALSASSFSGTFKRPRVH